MATAINTGSDIRHQVKRLAILLLFPALSFAATTITAIHEDIQRYGAAGFSTHLSPADWQLTLDNISSGKSEWIALAVDLAPLVNQQQADQLTTALYYSLAPNATATLKTLAALDKQHNRYQQGTALSCLFPLDKSMKETVRVYHDTRLSLLDAGPQAAECLWLLEGWMEQVKAENLLKNQSVPDNHHGG